MGRLGPSASVQVDFEALDVVGVIHAGVDTRSTACVVRDGFTYDAFQVGGVVPYKYVVVAACVV